MNVHTLPEGVFPKRWRKYDETGSEILEFLEDSAVHQRFQPSPADVSEEIVSSELSRDGCAACFNDLMQYSREICKTASEGDRDTYINTKNALKALLKTLYATPNEKEPE
ncbi:hypothetical protein PsorP6_015900 [Peronosclerospora sorghi]|uniref:Uncharacterized protein n=1 Tax=Peronosclerospora sorghi TaxID=230839 RepID=A0ACC0WQ96_9STRA|nr:hypothetical protein PsorP6_015900 [Peronosclerospora sorghi]